MADYQGPVPAEAGHPQRVRLSRRRGARLPEGTVVVARPSKWGNPFPIGGPDPDGGRIDSAVRAVRLFSDWLTTRPDLVAEARVELRGRNLACWCPPGPCHADVLLRIANLTDDMRHARRHASEHRAVAPRGSKIA